MRQEDKPDTLHLSQPGNNNNNNNNSNSTNYKGQTDWTGYKSSHYKDKKPDAIGVQMVNADDADGGATPAETEVKSPEDGLTIWNDEYYYCLRQQADDVDHHTGTCYNCQEPGHHWRECPHPLRQALQKAKDCDGIDEQRLNTSGDNLGWREPTVPRKWLRTKSRLRLKVKIKSAYQSSLLEWWSMCSLVRTS